MKRGHLIASDKSGLSRKVHFLLKSGFPVTGLFIFLKVGYLVAIVVIFITNECDNSVFENP